jgi:hypothetical protein
MTQRRTWPAWMSGAIAVMMAHRRSLSGACFAADEDVFAVEGEGEEAAVFADADGDGL